MHACITHVHACIVHVAKLILVTPFLGSALLLVFVWHKTITNALCVCVIFGADIMYFFLNWKQVNDTCTVWLPSTQYYNDCIGDIIIIKSKLRKKLY